MTTLTHDEATSRARLLTVRSYAVDLDLTRGDREFGSTTTIRFACTTPGADSFVEVKPVRLRRVTLNGAPIDPETLRDNRLPLPNLAADNELVVEADMAYSRTGEGLHRFTDPADGEVYLYAQSFLDHAQRIFACFDQPDLKARYTLSVTAPEGWTVLGNAPGREVAPGRWVFDETPPLSTYFVTVAAGRWYSRYQEHDGIPLGLHCRQSLAEAFEPDVFEIFTVTGQCFDRYHELFAVRYPFGKYDQVFVPAFNAGAMENPGCVTFRDDRFVFRSVATEAEREQRAMVIAHEMAHMWFGDLVTMRWWDDLWLNESFAEYMGHRIAAEATRFQDAWVGFCVRRKMWAYAADQRPSTHPVSGTVPDSAQALLNFDGISYSKGASVLRQLATWLGDETFFAGLNEYFARHAYRNASLSDLLAALAAHTDRDLTDWAKRWLTTAQLNTLRPVLATDAADRLTSVVIEQTAPRQHPTLRPHRIALGLYDIDGDVDEEGDAARVRRRRTVMVDVDAEASTPVPELVGERRPALLVPNDGDLGYAKLRVDEASWDTVTAHLHRVPDPLTRAVLWSAAWERMRDGELPALDYLHLVRTHLPYETAVAILSTVLTGAKPTVIDRYTPAAERSRALAVLADTCRVLLDRAEPGSSAQVLAARTFAQAAIAPEDLDLIADWRQGRRVPDGVAVDAALRWTSLLRLVVMGRAGAAEIDAELAADPSDAGQLEASRCRAAIPDPASKAKTWAAIRDDLSLSPHLLRATVEGFWQPEQADLLAEYLPRYFAELPEIAARRNSPQMDRVLADFGFPPMCTDEVVGLAEKLLETDLGAGLARHLTDQLDETRRAVAARHGR